MATPWYAYPADRPGTGYGFTEPQCPGCYKKPDVNIAVPSGTAITALLPGTISSSQDLGGTAGGLSVTEKLDQPLNQFAQYVSYNFLGTTEAYVGEHVIPGTEIGTAGSKYGVYQAVGLGVDPVWGHGQFIAGSGNPLTNPETQLIDKLKAGLPIQDLGSGLTFEVSQPGQSGCPWYCALTPFATWGPCSGCTAQSTGNTQADNALKALNDTLNNLTAPEWWARVGVILLGGIIILIGAWKLLK